jgi:hypothetical protein
VFAVWVQKKISFHIANIGKVFAKTWA